MDVLVACPISRRKGYSLHEWEQATKGHDRLMVTEEADFLPEIYKAGVTALPYEVEPYQETLVTHSMTPNKFNPAWRTIIEHAGYHDFILSLESDIIPPERVDIVQTMIDEWDGTVEFLIHLYPYRSEYHRTEKAYEMGCTMASTKTWEKALNTLPAGVGLYWSVYQTKEMNPRHYFTSKRIDVVELKHLEA